MSDFEEAAGPTASAGVLGEFLYFLRRSRKWWLVPLVVVLVLLGILIVLSSTGAAPFIYTLF